MTSLESVGVLQPAIKRLLAAFVRYCEILALAIFFQAASNLTDALLIDVLAEALYLVSIGYFGYFLGKESSKWLDANPSRISSSRILRLAVHVTVLLIGALVVSSIQGAVEEVALVQVR